MRGLLLAACIPALAAAVTSPGLGASVDDPASIAGISLVLYMPSLFITGMLGLPIYLVLKRFGWMNWWACAAAGFLSDTLFIFIVDGGRWPANAQDWCNGLAWGAIGAFSAVCAWASWRLAQTPA